MTEPNIRREARIRGSGSRNVQVEGFEIIAKPTKKRTSLRGLESAFVKSEDIENLPRFRRRSSQSTDSTPLANRTNNSRDLRLKPESRPNQDIPESYDGANDDNYMNNDGIDNDMKPPTPVRSVGRPKKVKTNRGRPKKIQSPIDESIEYTKSMVSQRMRTSRLKNNFESSQNNPLPEQDLSSKMKQIQSNVEKRQQLLKKAKITKPTSKIKTKSTPKTVTSIPTRSLRSRLPQTPSSPPVPLTKTKRTETQKPLVVNIERLLSNRDGDKRTKVHTFDVLKHLVAEFDASEQSLLDESCKVHIQYHLDRLMDAHASINSISQQILRTQRMKNEMRNKIYELRKLHTSVGNELNQVRQNFADKKKSVDELVSIKEQLKQLKDEQPQETNQSDFISTRLSELKRIINPRSGIFSKLTAVNEKLQKLDDEMA